MIARGFAGVFPLFETTPFKIRGEKASCEPGSDRKRVRSNDIRSFIVHSNNTPSVNQQKSSQLNFSTLTVRAGPQRPNNARLIVLIGLSVLIFPRHGHIARGGNGDILAAVVHLHPLDPGRGLLVDRDTSEHDVGGRTRQETALVGGHDGLQHKLHTRK